MFRALKRDGWTELRTSGSHILLHHPTKPGRPIIPYHAGILAPKTYRSIIIEAALTDEQLPELLQGLITIRFTVVLFHDKETGVYDAVIPALPNCVTQSATIEEALVMAQDAVELRLATMGLIDDDVLGESEAEVVATVDVRVPVSA